MKALLSILLLGFALNSLAAPTNTPALEAEVRNLQNRIDQLTNDIDSLTATNLQREKELATQQVTCFITDTHRGERHKGTGFGREQALKAAKTSCEENTFDYSCNGSTACTTQIANNTIAGYQCELEATGGRGVFNAESSDLISAESAAKQACEDAVLDSYCTDAKISCRPIN